VTYKSIEGSGPTGFSRTSFETHTTLQIESIQEVGQPLVTLWNNRTGTLSVKVHDVGPWASLELYEAGSVQIETGTTRSVPLAFGSFTVSPVVV